MSSERRRVSVVPGRGLHVGDETVPLVSGAMHYWRVDRSCWPAALDAAKDLGFRIIETYVPWSVHEVGRGRYDFSGDRDVVAFLRMVHERGLLAVVRPGPHINAELGDFGFPRRVLDDPRCQARSYLGTPVMIPSRSAVFPAPSYAAPEFRREVDGWYDAVAPLLAPLQWPDGPVVACQVDNEMGYFFHVDPYVMDYHDAFVDGWRAFSGHEGEPPTDGDAPAEVRDSWLRWRQHFIHRTLAELRAGLEARGLDAVPMFHNDFPALTAPLDQAALEASGAVDIAANDLYVQRDSLDDAKEVARTLSGSSQLPYIAEMGAGWVADPVGIPQRILPPDEEVALLTVLLCGVRAVNFYMLVDREHWYGSPISRRGELQDDDAALYRRALALLDRLDWWSLRREAPVLLLRDRDADRRWASQRWHSATAALLTPRQFPPDLRSADADRRDDQRDRLRACRSLLEAASLDFDEGSTDAPPALDTYELVVTCGDPAAVAHRNVVAADDLAAAQLPESPYRLVSAASGVSLHRFVGAGTEVVGVVNSTGETATFALKFEGRRTFTGCWRDDVTVTGDGSIELTLPPYSADLWTVRS